MGAGSVSKAGLIESATQNNVALRTPGSSIKALGKTRKTDGLTARTSNMRNVFRYSSHSQLSI